VKNFNRELERLDHKRDDMYRHLSELGRVSIVENRYPNWHSSGEDFPMVCQSDCIEIRDVFELDKWYLHEVRKLMNYYERERDYETWAYGRYSSFDRMETEYRRRELELMYRRTEDRLRELSVREHRLYEYERHLKSQPLPTPQPFTSLPTPTMCGTSLTVVQKARELFLAKDEKLLRKAGLKDTNGNWTNDSIRVFVEMLLEDGQNKKKLLELAKELTRKKQKEEDDE